MKRIVDRAFLMKSGIDVLFHLERSVSNIMKGRSRTIYQDVIPNASWYNRSLAVHAPQYLICLGEAIKYFFNPTLISLFLEFMFIILYIKNFEHQEYIYSYLCEFHHLILPPMVHIVGLYGLFRQRRPSKKYVNGVWYNVGTIYGMPSGDAFFAGIISFLLMKKSPFFSLFLVVFVSFAKTIIGFHTIGQVIAGALLGIFTGWIESYISMTNFLIGNWIIAAFLPLIVFFDNLIEIVEVKDFNNLQIWVVIDSSYLVFDILQCSPNQLKPFPWLSDGARLTISILLVIFIHLLSFFLCFNRISIVRSIKRVFTYVFQFFFFSRNIIFITEQKES